MRIDPKKGPAIKKGQKAKRASKPGRSPPACDGGKLFPSFQLDQLTKSSIEPVPQRASPSSMTLSDQVIGEGVQPVSSLLSLQEVGDSQKQDILVAVHYGHDLLDQMEQIKISLLEGRLDAKQLIELQKKLKQIRMDGIDHQLRGIIKSIELRAKVELAKYQAFKKYNRP